MSWGCYILSVEKHGDVVHGKSITNCWSACKLVDQRELGCPEETLEVLGTILDNVVFPLILPVDRALG